jgi:lysophospholipase L1-like esterase
MIFEENSRMQTVVCFGDSITRGQVSANYVEMLEERLDREAYRFVNCGVNNDFSYNLLERVEQVIALEPQVVIILIGTNDVIATLDTIGLEVGLLIKRLPQPPDLEWYRANVVETVERLKAGTQIRIGLASIPVLGEDLESLPIQRVKIYNEVLKEIAGREQVGYIPVFERQAETLIATQSGKGRPYEGDLQLSVELLASRFLRKESYDSISRREGFTLLTDGVHLNNQGAEIIAHEIEAFILAASPPGTTPL